MADWLSAMMLVTGGDISVSLPRRCEVLSNVLGMGRGRGHSPLSLG